MSRHQRTSEGYGTTTTRRGRHVLDLVADPNLRHLELPVVVDDADQVRELDLRYPSLISVLVAWRPRSGPLRSERETNTGLVELAINYTRALGSRTYNSTLLFRLDIETQREMAGRRDRHSTISVTRGVVRVDPHLDYTHLRLLRAMSDVGTLAGYYYESAGVSPLFLRGLTPAHSSVEFTISETLPSNFREVASLAMELKTSLTRMPDRASLRHCDGCLRGLKSQTLRSCSYPLTVEMAVSLTRDCPELWHFTVRLEEIRREERGTKRRRTSTSSERRATEMSKLREMLDRHSHYYVTLLMEGDEVTDLDPRLVVRVVE